MECSLVKSDRIHANGKPYWFCSNEGCDRRCVSEDGNCNVGSCKSTDPVAIAKAKELAERQPKKRCLPCEKKKASYGLGDLVGDGIKLVTFGKLKAEDCEGCMKRKQMLNDLLPKIIPSDSTEA